MDGVSYPVFVDKEIKFLEQYALIADKYYFKNEFGRIQGMFASEFEAVTAMILQYFGIIDEFVEGMNLHVKSNFGLKSIDFRVFYLNSKGKMVSFLVESHPWTRAELNKNRSNGYTDAKKFNAITRPELHGERYYFIESIEDLYKMIYRFDDHLEKKEYDRKIYHIRGQQAIRDFRSKHLQYKKVVTDYVWLPDRTTDCENILDLVRSEKYFRSKEIKDLKYDEFLQFFEECKASVCNASYEKRKKINQNHINFVKDFVKLPTTQYDKHYTEYRMTHHMLGQYLLLVKNLFETWYMDYHMKTIFFEYFKQICEIFVSFNYFIYISIELRCKFGTEKFDEVMSRRIVDVVLKKDNRDRFKGWFLKKVSVLYAQQKISKNVFQEMKRYLEYV